VGVAVSVLSGICEEIPIPYPMHYGLRFYVDKSEENWPSFWLHGRDMPGYPASHGCIGLYDEEMQKKVYKDPKNVRLKDAKKTLSVGRRLPC
jgi:hypothetical protein